MGNAQSPFSGCCGPQKNFEANSLAFNKVELAASELFSLALVAAYHTSVLVNGEEFFFSDSGIFSDRALNSHEGAPSERIPLGYSDKTGTQLLQALRPHFMSGTYDLVCKNCNSFTDCALYYLLGQRLERRFCAIEQLGQSNTELLSQVTNGMYTPNKTVQDFRVEVVMGSLNKLAVEGKQADVGDNKPAKSQPAIVRGSHVTIIGVANAPSLNGQGATVNRYNPLNGRWECRIHLSGEKMAFRAENLRPAGELVLETGDLVKVWGLKSESGQTLNGREGEVICYMHDVSRYEVRFPDIDAPKALKAENLQGESPDKRRRRVSLDTKSL